MSNNQPRVPVRFIDGNQELIKAQTGTATPGPGWAGQRAGTGYRGEEEVYQQVPGGVVSSYRTPAERSSGNQLFRRYPNGLLDVAWAKHQVLDALHRAKDSGGQDQLNSLEKVALSVLFPHSFSYVDSAMVSQVASVQLRLTPDEVVEVRQAVARHLAEEMNWNSGLGGNSVPGRHTTRS